MNCGSCQAIADHFGDAHAEEDLLCYQRSGPDKITRILLGAIQAGELRRATLLDVGGGVGIIAHELLAAGVATATLVDIAAAHVQRAQAEARQRGHHERMRFITADFVQIAQDLPPADIVTLDRVVCCYPDAERLVALSATKARYWYALSYPRDRWYVRTGDAFSNWRRQRRGEPFRTYVHPEQQIHSLLRAAGFHREFRRNTFIWQVALYRRSPPS